MKYLHAVYDPIVPENLLFFGEDYSRSDHATLFKT